MPSLRPSIVVTLSLASLTPCCNEEPARPSVTPDPPRRAPTSSPTSAPVSTPRSEPTAETMLEPHRFEEDETIVNPRVGKKVAFWDGFSSCYTLGPENERTSGVQFAHQPVACPEAIETLLAGCAGSLLFQRGDACSCAELEGNPPQPAEPIACPKPRP